MKIKFVFAVSVVMAFALNLSHASTSPLSTADVQAMTLAQSFAEKLGQVGIAIPTGKKVSALLSKESDKGSWLCAFQIEGNNQAASASDTVPEKACFDALEKARKQFGIIAK